MSQENYKFGRYINNNQETRWATIDEIKKSGAKINLSDEDYPVGGLPLISDAKQAWVDDKDTHSLIFGATGSKKTRLFCMPLINIFAKAGESFVVTDPKGELYQKTSGLVKSKGYKTIVLNFRDIGFGDKWNPLSLPYELYHSGDKEKGVSMLNDFVTTIASPIMENTKDTFWPEMASSLALANLLMLMEYGTKEEVNVGSLGSLCSANCEEPLKELAEKMSPETIAGMNYRGVLVSADNTRRSILVSLYAMVRIFNTQRNLTKMLSGNSVDFRNIGREKTAIYIIVPDEKTTYHFLVTTFLKQIYEILIGEAQKDGGKLPIRVNFVLDEFCNLPKIPDMPSMISAARSRNMRYYLVAQSLHQLKGKYGEDADTIKGNCDNWVFLTSKELDLLNEISELCGTVYTADNRHRKLISVSELQRFDKEKGEALIMHSRQYPIITEMPDIDSYEAFKGYEAPLLVPYKDDELKLFSIEEVLRKAKRREIKWPFSGEDNDFNVPQQPSTPNRKPAVSKMVAEEDLDLLYNNIFDDEEGE